MKAPTQRPLRPSEPTANGTINKWYFVSHLAAAQREALDLAFEVQLLDEKGRGLEVRQFTLPAEEVALGGTRVPSQVLAAAGQLREGQGCYVDRLGWEVDHLGDRLPEGTARTTGTPRDHA